jgi:hypothetical protein
MDQKVLESHLTGPIGETGLPVLVPRENKSWTSTDPYWRQFCSYHGVPFVIRGDCWYGFDMPDGWDARKCPDRHAWHIRDETRTEVLTIVWMDFMNFGVFHKWPMVPCPKCYPKDNQVYWETRKARKEDLKRTDYRKCLPIHDPTPLTPDEEWMMEVRERALTKKKKDAAVEIMTENIKRHVLDE